MAEEKPLDARAIRLELTVPCDARFRQVLSAICQRLAAYVGYPEPEAAELADMIVHATDGVLVHEEASECTSLDVTFATSEEEMEIRVRYLCEGKTGDRTDRPGIERLLSRRGEDEAPLDIIRRVMQRVEFGQDNGVEYCTLSKPLPEER